MPSKATFAKLKAKEPASATMSKSEIQSWLNNTASTSSNGDSNDEIVWQRDRVLNDWEKSLEYAQDKLLRAQTKLRVQFLREELLSLAKHAGMIWRWCQRLVLICFHRSFVEADHGRVPLINLDVPQVLR